MLFFCFYYVWFLNEFVKEYFCLFGSCVKFLLGNWWKLDYEVWVRIIKKYICDVDFYVLENRFESWCNLVCKFLEWRLLKCVNCNFKIKWIIIIDIVGDFWVIIEIYFVIVVLWLYMCVLWCYFCFFLCFDIIFMLRILFVS